MKLNHCFLIIASLIITSCSSEELPKYELLTGLRVLAMIADQPEAAPGATVIITPHVSDITETAGLTYQAVACIDPGVAYGADPSCDNNATSVNLASGSISTLTVAKAFTGPADQISVTIPLEAVIFANRSAQQKHNGVAYLIDYRISNSRGEVVKAVKRILVSSRSVKNSNPTLIDIVSNGLSISSLPVGTTANLVPEIAGSPAEAFDLMLEDGTLRSEQEELLTTWFITDGELAAPRTLGVKSVEYNGPSAAPTGRDAFIYAIMRDGRGGATVVRKCFGACP